MRFLGLWWSTMASSVFVDEKRLSIVSRATSARPGVVPVVASGVSWPTGGVVPTVPLVSLLHAPRSPVEDGQHDCVDLREERRWHDISPLLLLTREVLLLAHSLRLRILPVFIPTEENLHADAASRFQSLPD